MVARRLRVDAGRLRDDLLVLGEIGAEPDGGVTRLAYSPEEARARAWIAERFSALGLAVRTDPAGNLIARRPGTGQGPCVMTGSHLDTVPSGGRFDGAAGCVAALEVARVLQREGIVTRRPIEFVVFAAEESPRFKAGNRFGSRAMAGQVREREAWTLSDAAGITLAEAMERLGLDPASILQARRDPGEIAAFVELHIEQGTHLAQAAVPAGIVTSIAGTRRYLVDLIGRADHSGGTPMGARRDALAAAAEVILAVEQIAFDIGGTFVGTATTLTVEPNAMNVVPERARLGIDLRDVEAGAIEAASDQVQAAIGAVCARRQIESEVRCIRDTAPQHLSARIQDCIEVAAARVGVPVARVPSHTGHDTTSLNAITDAGMIFVRNPSGQSHSSAESLQWADLAAATEVLLETVVMLSGE